MMEISRHRAIFPDSALGFKTRENLDFMALTELISCGQTSALKSLYDCTASRIYATAFRVLRSEQDAEEIVCDVFMYVWGHAQQYSRTRGSVMAWLIVMTRNRAIDRIRKRQQNLSIDDEKFSGGTTSLIADLQSPEDMLAQIEEGSAVHGAMASLSPLRRNLVELSFFKELTHEEIANTLAMPQGTVESHLRRGLIAMRTAMTLGCAPSQVWSNDRPALRSIPRGFLQPRSALHDG